MTQRDSGRTRGRKLASVPDTDSDGRPALSVEGAVREALADADPVAPGHHALVATALTLARKLDDGAGMATAAVAKELRATLDAILKVKEAGNDDGLDEFVNGLGLPAAMGHSPLS